jgi:hypothetical protein
MDKKEREKMYSYRPTDTQTNPPHTHIIYEQKTQKYGHTKFQKTMKPGAGAGASAESILAEKLGHSEDTQFNAKILFPSSLFYRKAGEKGEWASVCSPLQIH